MLVYLISRLDALLCHVYRINEFVDDPDCLLRLAIRRAPAELSLRDGTRVVLGDPVGELHLWNDHLPHFPTSGPTLGWARRVHNLMVHSLSLLANFVASEPEWQSLQAFYADVPISPRRSLASVRRASLRYGFEPELRHPTFWRSFCDALESLLLGSLAYAYNPPSLGRQAFLRHRQRIWNARPTLIRLYGATGS